VATADQADKTTNRMLDRQPPCSIEAEQAVLGSILLLPEVSDEVALIVRPADFYDDANLRIY
jgi:replicative DNA helicase